MQRLGTDLEGGGHDGAVASSSSAAAELQPLLPKVVRRVAFTGGGGPAQEQLPPRQQPTLQKEHSGLRTQRSLDLESNQSLASEHVLDNTDPRRELVDKLLKHPELSSDKLDHKALAKGQQKLYDLLDDRPVQGGIDEELPNIMIYKGRPLFSARVLHLAVWCAAQLREASLVELVLKKMIHESEFYAKAKYWLVSRKSGWNCELRLDALHIACGLGSLPAVQVLLNYVANQGAGDGVSSPSLSPGSRPSANVRDYVNMFTIKHYMEDANPNNFVQEQFYCPIHEAADKGFVDVALTLLQHGADGGLNNLDGLAPLHFLAMRGSAGGIATGDGDCLRKVVQALQDSGGSLEARVYNKHYNPKWAGKTPLELAAADDSRFPRQMMWLLVPCLQDNSVSEPRYFADIAFLTALDSEAATSVVREISARAAKNNNVLQRFRLDAQMEGRTDNIAGILFLAPEAGGLMLEMLVGDPIVQDVSKHNIPTRTSMYGFWKHLPMRCIYRGDAIRSSDNVLLPVWSYEINVPIEQQPQIAWHRWLVPETEGLALRTEYVYNINVSTVLLPNILDLDMFMALGRSLKSQIKVFGRLSVQGMIYCLWNNLVDSVWLAELIFYLMELVVLMWWGLAWPLVGPRAAFKADKPFCWAIITAGAFREAIQVMLCFKACLEKYHGHHDLTMKSMWHPMSSLFVQWAFPKLSFVMVQLRFAWGSREDLGDSELHEFDQVLLAIIVLLKATQVTYLFRLCAGGSKIYAIFYSFLGGATREMISITAMIFGSFSLAFMVLAKDKAVGWVLASSYRGLLFGDGDGFNNLGLDVHREDEYVKNDVTLSCFLVLGSFFFNIILLNLIIAVYGNEYDKVAGDTPFLFLHGRAKNCVTYILSCQMFPWAGAYFNWAVKATSAFMFMAGLFLHVNRDDYSWEMSTAVLFAWGQVLLQAALVQCDWFSIEGVAANKKEHFLWICHRDFEPDMANEALQVGFFEDQLKNLRSHVDNRMSTVEAKLDFILDRMDRLMEERGR